MVQLERAKFQPSIKFEPKQLVDRHGRAREQSVSKLMTGPCLGLGRICDASRWASRIDSVHTSLQLGGDGECHLWFLLEIFPRGQLGPNQSSFVDENLLK